MLTYADREAVHAALAALVSSYYYISVLIPLYICPHTTIYLSSYYMTERQCTHSVLILLYICPHTTIYVSSYYYICVLILYDREAVHAALAALAMSKMNFWQGPQFDVEVVWGGGGGGHALGGGGGGRGEGGGGGGGGEREEGVACRQALAAGGGDDVSLVTHCSLSHMPQVAVMPRYSYLCVCPCTTMLLYMCVSSCDALL
jgi:hypothetical protein